MATGLLFKWEDSPALCHHCGFCERPLNHPGARSSCFGPHAEPCHRYHQAMFMRLRSHTCNYCRTVDEAHYRRHKELAEQLRAIYESGGEVDWSIIPDSEERGRAREYDGGAAESEGATPNDALSSKREKKDAKSLVRAASRSRVITGAEIGYVDSVLHSAEGLSAGDSDAPRNAEEIEEVESHLRYNAHVYNKDNRGGALKTFAKLSDAEIDFDGEVERILEAFRVTELRKRNTHRTRGLQGKELKIFLAHVDEFKKAVVEDLVQVKRDSLEIRMRRAGYLRYTNKTAHGIVEERYLAKDWKTGEKFLSSTSESSGLVSPSVEEIATPQRHVDSSSSNRRDHNIVQANRDISEISENTPPLPTTLHHAPDRRHLEKVHKRITGEDGLEQDTIEPYHAPLLPMVALSALKKPAVQLKVIVGDQPIEAATHRERECPPPPGASWQTVLGPKKATKPSVKPSWGMTSTGRPVVVPPPPSNLWGPGACEIPDLRAFRAPAVQPPPTLTTAASRGPDQFVASKGPEQFIESPIAASELTDGHPVVSQKKAKKHEREAKRKAKKSAGQEDVMNASKDQQPALMTASAVTSTRVAGSVVKAPKKTGLRLVTSTAKAAVRDVMSTPGKQVKEESVINTASVFTSFNAAVSGVNAPKKNTAMPVPSLLKDAKSLVPAVEVEPSLLPVVDHKLSAPLKPEPYAKVDNALLVTQNGKHMHWLRFQRQFRVDQLTEPLVQFSSGCGLSTSCLFETSGVLDCPFHEPHCACVDPRLDQCHLVYPCKYILSSGPYNRLRGEKLLAMYQTDHRFKDRIMLVDEELMGWFVQDPLARIPPRLSLEHSLLEDGYTAGPLMKQENKFGKLYHSNNLIKHEISPKSLADILVDKFEHTKTPAFCYCHYNMPKGGVIPEDVVECTYRDCKLKYFHKSCVKELGFEKVSRWLCTDCEARMQSLANRFLGGF